MICLLSHQKALAQFSNKPAQCLTLRPPLTRLLLSQVNAAGVSPGRAGSDRATAASGLPTTHPRSAESETEKLDLDLGIRLAKGMKKKRNASHPGTRLWQYQSLEKKTKKKNNMLCCELCRELCCMMDWTELAVLNSLNFAELMQIQI